jgi:cell filamentation protein
MNKPYLNKYTTSDNETESTFLPNLLQLENVADISLAEFEGFIKAQQKAIDALTDNTVFDLLYLYNLHHDALAHLYTFAGKLRTVNMSKDSFAFPAASFLPQEMDNFEKEFLLQADTFADMEAFVRHLARMHAELLFIHPFREGNGRSIRLFTNLLYIAKTGQELDFVILEKDVAKYIKAVQQAGLKEYTQMEDLFLEMTSGIDRL